MRKWKAFLSLMLVFLFISSSAFATSSSSKYIKVRMDGKTISVLVAPIMVDGKLVYTDDPSFISGNTTYVPMRFISDQFGGKIEWNESTNTATVTVDNKVIKLTIGSKNVYVNGEKRVIEDRFIPKLATYDYGTSKARGRTVVPLRLIAQLLGYEIGFDEAKAIPIINRVKQNNNNGSNQNSGNNSTSNDSKYIKVRMDGKTISVLVAPIMVDGKLVYTDDPSFISGNTTYVPMRFISDQFGGKIEWNESTNTATVTVDNKVIKLTIGSKNVYVNGEKRVIEDRFIPKLATYDYGTSKARGRTVVPLRLIAQLLGYEIGFDEAKAIPIINRPTQNNNNNNNGNNQNKDQTTIVNTVKEIKKETVNGREAIVIYKTNNVEISQQKLTGPVRLIFDLKASLLTGGGYHQYNISIGPVKGVRVSQFTSDVVRVVLDIKDGINDPQVEVINQKDKLILIPTVVENQTPQKPSIVIFIDPGHGGHDPGAVQNGVNEKDINLQVGLKLNDALKKAGYDTIIARDSDVYLTLEQRYNMANNSNSNIFISLHCNSFTSSSAHGIEVYYCPPEKSPVKEVDSKPLAEAIHDELVKATGAKGRGAKEGTFAVIKNTTMPAILIEMGFISNSEEAQKLQTDSYQNKIVEGIVKGLQKYFATYGK
jgi:N-acetylmuramoyl-L-alanine amidase